MKQIKVMKEMMVAAAMVVGLSANAQSISPVALGICGAVEGDTTTFNPAYVTVPTVQKEKSWFIKLSDWCTRTAELSNTVYVYHGSDFTVRTTKSGNSVRTRVVRH